MEARATLACFRTLCSCVCLCLAGIVTFTLALHCFGTFNSLVEAFEVKNELYGDTYATVCTLGSSLKRLSWILGVASVLKEALVTLARFWAATRIGF